MTDNSFSEELGQLPPDLTLGATSDQIMQRGRRIRTIRQSSIVGAAALAVVGIVSTAAVAGTHHGTRVVHTGSGGGSGISLPGPAPAAASSPVASMTASAAVVSAAPTVAAISPLAVSSAAPPATTAPPATASCTPAPQSAGGAPAATSDGNPPPWGTLVPAGTDLGTGKTLVLYGFHIDDSAIPCTHFGMMLGTSDASGTNGVTGMYAANEFDGSDLEPGFHAVSLSGGGNQVAGSYYIGYYVGAAASVSVLVNGVLTAAHVAPWSVNPDVTFWWIGGDANSVPTYGTLSAKDAAGNTLPVGNHAQPGVG